MLIVLVIVPIVAYALVKIFLYKNRYKLLSSNLKVKNDEYYDIETCTNKDNYIEHSIVRQRNIVANKDQISEDIKESTTKKEYKILPRPYGVNQGLSKHVIATTNCGSLNRNLLNNYSDAKVCHNVANVISDNDVTNQLLNSNPIVDLTIHKSSIINNYGNDSVYVKSQYQSSLNQYGLIASVALKELRLNYYNYSHYI